MENDYSDINNYIMEKEIGEGNFGKVKLAKFKPTGEEFAIKILNKKKIKKQMKNVMLRENEIITKLNHINIVFVYKIIETEEDYFIVMEYCKLGELFDYIVQKKRLEEEEAAVFFYQLINGVEYIHSKGIAHRDLKPENLLLTEDKVLKIIDFGLSHEFTEEEFLKTKCGSPSYAAPEIIAKPKYDGFKIDIWCCGIILYAMLCGYLPFDGDDESENNNLQLFRNILECEPEIPDFLSNISRDLILRILRPDPTKRISLKNIKRHPFYTKGKKLCTIDYSSCEREIIKTRESFYKSNNKNNNKVEDKEKEKEVEKEVEKQGNLDENAILENNKNDKIDEKKENKNNLNFNNHINITDGNVKSPGKNSIEIFAKNNYKSPINEDSHYLPTTIDSMTKNNKFNLFLKTKNKQKYEFNTFKKRFNNQINLHKDNQKKIEKYKILNTDNNENINNGLPFIGISLRDTEIIINSLLARKMKQNGENQNNNYSLNINKPEEEISNYIKKYKSPMRYGHHPQILTKINPNSNGYKINSVSKGKKPNYFKLYQDKEQTLFEKIKPNVKNNINNDNIISNLYKNQRKNENRLKQKLNLNMNSINNTRIKGNGISNAVNTFAPGNLVLSLSNEKKINRKKNFNRYNYEYEYNFNHSPNKNILIKESYTEALNSTNNINKNNNFNANNKNITNNDIKTIVPVNIKNSDQNIKTISKKYSKGDNKVNSKSPEMKSIYNNIKINININSNTVDKYREKKKEELKTLNLNNLQNKIIEQKLYMLTDSNKDIINNEIYKSIGSSPNKNYINNSERSGKRRGVSLLNGKKDSKYNLTKMIQNVKNGNSENEQKDIIKKNKSYVDNHSSIDTEDQLKNKNNIGRLKIININSDKRKNKDDLRYNLFKNKNIKDNNYKKIITTNNNFLPKLNEHNYINNNNNNNINKNIAKNI